MFVVFSSIALVVAVAYTIYLATRPAQITYKRSFAVTDWVLISFLVLVGLVDDIAELVVN